MTRRLVADIGGTRARMALVDASGRIGRVRHVAVADSPDLVTVLADFLAAEGEGDVVEAALAVAAPVFGDDRPLMLTNATWKIDPAALRSRFDWQRLVLLNDFEALALALPALEASDLRRVGGDKPERDAPRAVLGPGTGLGAATLFRCGERWCAVAGEGGHVTLAAADAREAAIIERARRNDPHVSAERLVSGGGLPLLHRCVCEVDGVIGAPEGDSAAAIIGGALAGDNACRASVATFLAMLATVAGNLALTVGARGGIYLGGGVVPRLVGDDELLAGFRRRFDERGRFSAYLAAIPVYVILSPDPALIGAAAALRNPGGGR